MTKLATTLQSECNETLELVRIHRAIFDLLGRYKRGRTFNQLVAAIKADPADVAIVLRRLRTNEHLTTTLRPVRNGEYSSHYIQNSPDPERSRSSRSTGARRRWSWIRFASDGPLTKVDSPRACTSSRSRARATSRPNPLPSR